MTYQKPKSKSAEMADVDLWFELRNLNDKPNRSKEDFNRENEIRNEIQQRKINEPKPVNEKERADRYIHANPDAMKRMVKTLELPLYDDRTYSLFKTVIITDQWTPADFKNLSAQYPNTYVYTAKGTKPVYLLGQPWDNTDFKSLEQYYNALSRKQAMGNMPNVRISPKMPKLKF